MKDLQDIIALARQASGDRAALATLVSVDGSSYRRPGASMLMTADGRRAGGISGGCLERDVERHAREVLADGTPRLVLYDTQSEADLIIGTGLGCGGRLEILVEPIALSIEFGPIARWAGALERREALAEVMIVAGHAASAAVAPADIAAASHADGNANDNKDANGEAKTNGDANSHMDVDDAAVAATSSWAIAGRKAHAAAPVGWRLFLWSHALTDAAWHPPFADAPSAAPVDTDATAPAATASAATASAARAREGNESARRERERGAAAASSSGRSGAASVAGGAAAALASVVDAAGRAAREALAPGARSAPIILDTLDGPLPAFVRVVTPPVQLLVCGAGDDAMPLVRMACTLGWYVRVIDHRAGFATRDRFPDAAHVDVAVAGELPASVRLDARTVAVAMNHNFRADSAWLRSLAALPLPYVGVLGARSRTERLLRDAELATFGTPGAPGLRHLFAPAGLDLGSEGAEQIALAIVAEIQAVLAGRAGTSLRDRAAAKAASASVSASPQAPQTSLRQTVRLT